MKPQTVLPHYNDTLGKWICCYQKFNTKQAAEEYARSYKEYDGGYFDHVSEAERLCN